MVHLDEKDPAPAVEMERDLDLVVFGATGTVGELVCEHIAREYPGVFTWAMAGRSHDKLECVAKSLRDIHPECDPHILVCDATDQEAVDAVISRTRAVISTTGPFMRNSRSIAEACARLGTDYFDVAGEPNFVRWSVEHLSDKARQSGARLVHMAGFDAVPADMGTYHIVTHIRNQGLLPGKVHAVPGSIRGGISGGTLNTVVAMFDDFSVPGDEGS